ncbi:MAG: hypothetical protein GX031_08730 [Candidatus Riflebacteria bacterium]|nr:hypothetical protein [Candidatus Riflebacteria bacterium]NLV94612.1 hypothetical protein [Candidatus Riflebacteria bacterium]
MRKGKINLFSSANLCRNSKIPIETIETEIMLLMGINRFMAAAVKVTPMSPNNA